MPSSAVKGDERTRRLAQAALGPVADHGAADFSRRGEADANKGLTVGAIASLDHHRATRRGRSLRGREEIGPLA